MSVAFEARGMNDDVVSIVFRVHHVFVFTEAHFIDILQVIYICLKAILFYYHLPQEIVRFYENCQPAFKPF